jgi:hypothetical protein
MLSKEVAWIPDQNNGSYNGSIVFDCSALGTSNRWLSYSEAYIEIPYVIGMQGSADITANVNANTATIKDGFHHLIDSISVELNQKTVCQVQNFSNVHAHFRMLTGSSAEDIIKNRVTTGFYGESVNGLTYSQAATVNGLGFINNGTTLSQREIEITGNDMSGTVLPSVTKIEVLTSGRSYFNNTGAAAARIYYWVVMATIRLRDITDVFDKMPLCKLSDVRLNIVYNSINAVVAATTGGVLTLDSYQQVSGHSNPVILSAFTLTGSPGAMAAANITIKSNILKSGLGETPTLPIGQCRLYVPTYKIADDVSMSMIQSFPQTRFEFNDLYSFYIPSVSPGSFTYTLTTGIVNPQYVVVIPYARTNGLTDLEVSQMQSPFDTAPATSSAVMLKEFNVQVGGINVFQSNQRYEYEQFMDELSKINALNGNNSTGLTSGVINLYMFMQGYRMYVANVARREASNDNVTKSIVIQGVNTMLDTTGSTGLDGKIDLLCFVAYRKSVTFNTATGTVSD